MTQFVYSLIFFFFYYFHPDIFFSTSGELEEIVWGWIVELLALLDRWE